MRCTKDGRNTATVKSVEQMPTGSFKVTAEALTSKDVVRVEIGVEKVEYEDRAVPDNDEPQVKRTVSVLTSARPQLVPGDTVSAIWYYA